MPNVYLKYSERVLPDWVNTITGELAKIVAEALNSDGEFGKLEPKMVAVMPEKLSDMAINTKDVDVTILANDYPERKENLKERREKIQGDLLGVLGNFDRDLTMGVYVVLGTGSYGESPES